MTITCPCCNHKIDLFAAAELDDARKLAALIWKQPDCLRGALVQYLALFKPAKSQLTNNRALFVAGKVLELESDPAKLGAALVETTAAIRAKEGPLPLKGHGYLIKVLATQHVAVSAARSSSAIAPMVSQPAQPPSKTAAAVQALNELR